MMRTGTESSGTYQAIILESDATIPGTATVIYEGGGYISLNYPFDLQTGGDFEAKITNFPITGIQSFFTIKDHLGSTRVVFSDLDDNGSVTSSEIITSENYYPFGARHYNSTYSTLIHNRYYTGKELFRSFNLDYTRFDFRTLDAWIGRFLQVDPLGNTKLNVSMTPYHYVANNPLRFIDPTGAVMSPIYDENGKFLGTDSQGFTGEVLVFNSGAYNTLTNNGKNILDHQRALGLADDGSFASRLSETSVSPKIASNIFTDIVRRLEGRNIGGSIFSLKNLEGRAISVIDTELDEQGYPAFNGENFNNAVNISDGVEALTTDKGDNIFNVTTRLTSGRVQQSTVEHIQSTFGIHEILGHGIKNIPGGSGETRAYRLEFYHKSTFNELSPQQKLFIRQNAKIK